MLDKEKMSGYDEGAGVFMVIKDKDTGEKSEVNFKNIIAGGNEKKDELAKQVSQRKSQRKFVM